MSEPIGVMKCFECCEKHSRDLEHHLEDIIRVSPNPQERLMYEDWIDKVREIRRYSHSKAKDIAVEEDVGSKDEVVSFSDPLRVERGHDVWTEVYHEKEECDPRSFRTVKPNPEHIVTVCCPKGQYDEASQRCSVGTMGQRIEHLHPEGEHSSCPTCGGA